MSNFDETNSVPVVLADGQLWWLPKPWLEIRPVFQDGKADANFPVLTYGPEIDGLIAVQAKCETLDEQLTAVATLAACLLRWHYVLGDDELDQLLAYRVGEPASRAWFEEVMAIATGNSGPKQSRAGGG